MPGLNKSGVYLGEHVKGTGDGFGNNLKLSSDGNSKLIGSMSRYINSLTIVTKYQVVGRAFCRDGVWGGIAVIKGPENTHWGMGMAASANLDVLAVVDIKDFNTSDGGSIYIYDTSPSNLNLIGHNDLILSGGNSNTPHFTINKDGDIGINSAPTSGSKLYVDGNITATGSVNANSDDRLKENETLITNAIDTIQKLRPELYDKKPSFDNTDSNKWIRESGLMAQDVWQNAPELRHLVDPGSKIDIKYKYHKQ